MNETILPDVVRPGKHYSFRADLKLNFWAFVALLLAAFARWLLPSLIYVRAIARWIRGMDELQRRMQLEACLFATTGTVFIATALSLLAGFGLFQSTRIAHGLGWEGTFAVVVLLYILGNIVVNRRYR
jgi:hypothetical protein